VEAINRDEGRPFESAKEEIYQKLYKEAVDQTFLAWLEELRTRSHIKVIN
jgi:peptidyl-prolyl cis-trans isomerase SurA